MENPLFGWIVMNMMLIKHVRPPPCPCTFFLTCVKVPSGHRTLIFRRRAMLPMVDFSFQIIRKVYVYQHNRSYFLNTYMDAGVREDSRIDQQEDPGEDFLIEPLQEND